MGVPRDAWDLIVSSGDAAQEAMLHGAVGRKVWHLGPSKDDGFFENIPAEHSATDAIQRVPLDQAEGIVATGLSDELTETPEDYRERFQQAIDRGLPMLCANPDLVVDLGDMRIYCAGALAQLYEQMGGTAYYYGKPHAPIYALARKRIGLAPDANYLAIGDGIKTDIAGAEDQKIDSLFVTGGLAAEEFGSDVEAPVAQMLETWLTAQGNNPNFSIGRLR